MEKWQTHQPFLRKSHLYKSQGLPKQGPRYFYILSIFPVFFSCRSFFLAYLYYSIINVSTWTKFHVRLHGKVSDQSVHLICIQFGSSFPYVLRWLLCPTPCWSALDFWKIYLKKWISTKSIHGLFRAWISQAIYNSHFTANGAEAMFAS